MLESGNNARVCDDGIETIDHQRTADPQVISSDADGNLESDGSDDESRESKLIQRIKWALVDGYGSDNWKERIRLTYQDDHRKGLYLLAKVVTSDGEVFPVDKAIMMASSGYFHRAFACHRSYNSHHLATTLPVWLNVNKNVFRHVLDLIFTRRITNPRLDILGYFVKVCKDLEIHNSERLIGDWMLNTADSHNCIVYWRVSREHRMTSVCGRVFDTLLAQLEMVPISHIRTLAFEELSQIISHDKANIRREETTMKLIANWIVSLECDFKERTSFFSQLILMVRFGNAATGYIPRLISGQEFAEVMELIRTDPISIYLSQVHSVLLAIQADPSPARYDIYAYPFLRPRIPHDLIFIFGGYVGSSPCKLLETYDSRVNKWFKCDVSSMTQRSYHGMVYLNGLIYLVGGFDGHHQLRTTTLIDPVKKIWQDRAPLNHARCYVAVTEMNGKIYACGGFNGGVRHRTCEIYNPEENCWTEIAPMNEVRSDASAVSHSGRVYVIGGFNGQQVHNSVEFYDEQTGLWAYLSQPMVISRSGVNSVVWNDSIIVIGGNSGHHRENTVEVFDLKKGCWAFLPNLNTSRSNFAACVMENTLYVLGGYDGFGTTNNCEQIDLTRLPESKWGTVWPLSSSRSALTACVISSLPDAKQYSWLRKELEQPVPVIEKKP